MQVYVIGSRTGRSFELLSQLIKCVQLTDFNELWNAQPTSKPRILVSMGYMKKIPLSIYGNILTVNVHPGIAFPGRHPQLRALATLDLKRTDVTLHQVVSDEYDQGKRFAQIQVEITEKDRDDPNAFFERTRRIGVYLTAAWLIGEGAEIR